MDYLQESVTLLQTPVALLPWLDGHRASNTIRVAVAQGTFVLPRTATVDNDMGRIDGLPIELIAVILKDVLHHDIGEPGNHRWTDEPPIILQALSIAQVCKKWREFALNTPPLWTTFDGELHPLLIDYALQQVRPLALSVLAR